MAKKQTLPKIIIQIPCYNEAESLPITLRALPHKMDGFCVEWLIIDDGSKDHTAEIAIKHGVDHIVKHSRNLGLAKSFETGLTACLKLGADIIINTDADNQYDARDIPKLIAPILAGQADMVIGSRPIDHIEHFSPVKKFLQKTGSWLVRYISQSDVLDAPSGFRAINREAAKRLHIFDTYTYTLETLIQARQKGIKTTSVPIRTNKNLRPSRLISNTLEYVIKSLMTIVRISIIYRPMAFFGFISMIFFFAGLILSTRFLFFYALGQGQGHIQSLILTAILFGASGILITIGLISNSIARNRTLLERIDLRLFELELREHKKK
jgi:glycosyltransferase involved in cell wall biosynthesis